MTPTEQRFLRQLRDLLRYHGVTIHHERAYRDECTNDPEEWNFQGPDIDLSIHTVAEELEQP